MNNVKSPAGRVNPVANPGQVAGEETLLRLLAMPAIHEARERISHLWSLAYGEHVPEEARPSFAGAMREYVTNYTIKAIASDPNQPRFLRDFMPPHRWFDREIPGARMGGDNPDNCYRLAGIAHGGCYVVRGKPCGTAPASVTFTLVANYGTSVTIQTLDFETLQRAADDSFTLSIDAEPAAGRPNYLQTAPGVKFLYVRDTFADWARETPLDLTIERLDAPDAEALTDEQMVSRAVHRMVEEVPLYYWFTRLFSAKPVNTLVNPTPSGTLGGLVTQAGAQGRFHLADDEAMVVRVDPAGARYGALAAHDWWFRSLDYWNRTTSLNTADTLPDADGLCTYVVSPADPGAHNWIDTCGLHDVLMLYRWQGLPERQVRKGPAIPAVRLVKLRELESALPKNTVMVTPAERQRQREARAAAYARRLIEH